MLRRSFSKVARMQVPALVDLPFFQAHQSQVRIIDGSWLLKDNAHDKFKLQRIPNAIFFDLDVCATPSSLPHMMPSEDMFAHYAGNVLGVANDDPIIIYDIENSMFSAARVWYMFKVFGATNVGILKGGLNHYIKAGLPVHTNQDAVYTPVESKQFIAKLQANAVVNVDDILKNMKNQPDAAAQVVDVRSAGRFNATVPEPRPNLIGGHIPGSINVPLDQLVDPQTGAIKSLDELKQVFEPLGLLQPNKQVWSSCGSGVTACNVLYALHLLGKDSNMALYDGAWAEWGLPELKLPIEK